MPELAKNSHPEVRGFTLIEILVVIGIIAVLAAIVIIAINPARQFAQARNTQRTSDVSVLLNAIGQNLADNKGKTTCSGITATAGDIGSGGVDLAACLVPTYMPAIVIDPGTVSVAAGTLVNTKYQVSVDTNGRYTVTAPNAELSQTISLTR